MMKMKFFNIVIIIILLAFGVLAENITDTNTTDINITDTNTTNETAGDIPPEENITETPEEISDFTITNIVPNEFDLGDIQFNIQVLNNGTVELKNLVAIISGKGFSTYDIVSIDSLKSGEKSYIIVMANEKESGQIPLTIKINDKTFVKNISIRSIAAPENTSKDTEPDKEELNNLSKQLDDINKKYKQLEDDIESKKSNNYDVSNINLDDLKKFLRDAQSGLIQEDAEKSKVSITLAMNEYNDQKDRLDSAQMIKMSTVSVLKDNAVLISTLLASIIGLFTLWEILKKKKEHLYQKIKEVQINKDTKVIVEKKRKRKKENK